LESQGSESPRVPRGRSGAGSSCTAPSPPRRLPELQRGLEQSGHDELEPAVRAGGSRPRPARFSSPPLGGGELLPLASPGGSRPLRDTRRDATTSSRRCKSSDPWPSQLVVHAKRLVRSQRGVILWFFVSSQKANLRRRTQRARPSRRATRFPLCMSLLDGDIHRDG